ncbi:MAG: SH3 domain-containing protein [Anaerolineae bacterium]
MGRRTRSGPPGILVFLLAVALIFGVYYLWQGVQTFLRTGGMGVVEATERAETIRSATAVEATRFVPQASTLLPTSTEVPPCQEFRVSVPAGIVREGPSTESAIKTQFREGDTVCVLGQEPGSEWYSIDLNPTTRRIELAYMHETIIEAVNPTLTPSNTYTPSNTVSPPPTVTPVPSEPPTRTPTPLPSYTRDPRFTNTPIPTLTPSPTPSETPVQFQSA